MENESNDWDDLLKDTDIFNAGSYAEDSPAGYTTAVDDVSAERDRQLEKKRKVREEAEEVAEAKIAKAKQDVADKSSTKEKTPEAKATETKSENKKPDQNPKSDKSEKPKQTDQKKI